MTPPMMMTKQNPEKPAPPMAPSCPAVKPYSAPQLSKMPPRIAKPTPAAKMAMKPAHRSRLALGTAGVLSTLVIVVRFDWLLTEAGKFHDLPALECRLMGAKADAGPVRGLFRIGKRIAV